MPYKIRKLRNKNEYSVYNVDNGYVHAKHTTLAKAQAQIRLLNQIEHRRGRPSKTFLKTSSVK